MAESAINTEDQLRKCHDNDGKHVDRLISLYTHQNQLLWGRLQTIGIFQGAVFAAFYSLFFRLERPLLGPFLALLIAIIGIFLSHYVRKLIKLDLYHRRHYVEAIKAARSGLLIDCKEKPDGWLIIQYLAKLFLFLNIGLAVWTALYFAREFCFWISPVFID